jgi:hypothetical protein
MEAAVEERRLLAYFSGCESENVMQVIYCPNCQKRTGFRRALGFGTFFMALITFGLWLFVIPFYPVRCIVCGVQRQEALRSNLSTWLASRTTGQKVVLGLMLAGLAALIAITFSSPATNESAKPAVIVDGPNYDKPRSADSRQPSSTNQASQDADADAASHSTDHQLRLMPNLSGEGATEDGRVYSVALIAATPDIPITTKLFAQGRITRFGFTNTQSRPFVLIEDDQQSDKTLLCAMTEDEGAEVVSLYHVAESVEVSGDYMGNLSLAGNPVMPTLSQCQVASSRDDVVRPSEVRQ